MSLEQKPTFSLDSLASKLSVHRPCGPTDPQCPCRTTWPKEARRWAGRGPSVVTQRNAPSPRTGSGPLHLWVSKGRKGRLLDSVVVLDTHKPIIPVGVRRSLWPDSVSPKYGGFGLFPVVDRALCCVTVLQCFYYYTFEADVAGKPS